MNRLNSRLLMASLLMFLAGAGPSLAQGTAGTSHAGHHPGANASAQPQPQDPMRPGDGMSTTMMGGMMEHMLAMRMMRNRPEGRLAFLKAELAITDAQLPQWNAYADVVRAEAKAHTGGNHGMMMGSAKAQTWPERIAAREHELHQNLEAVRKQQAAAAALYDALTDVQKKTADELMKGPIGVM